MSRWFRFYDDSINDPKLLRLPDDLYRAWTILLCFASKNEGVLPSADDISIALRLKPSKVCEWITRLVKGGLIDDTGNGFAPHNWSGRQYQSDTSKERVKRHRDKRAAAGLIPQWTAPTSLRKAVYEADDFECVYCASTEFLSIDHKTSELNGGTHDQDNLVTACRSCNGAKRDLSFDEYVTKAKIVTLHGRYRNAPRLQTTEQTTEQSRPDARDETQKRVGDFRQAIVRAYSEANSPTLPDTSRAELWITQGYQEDICLAVIAGIVRKRPNVGLSYFDSPIAEAHTKKAPPRKAINGNPPLDWDQVLTTFKKIGHWSRDAGPDLDSPACRAPPEMLEKYGLSLRRMDA